MTKQEAIDIATAYVRDNAIENDGVENAVFVSRDRYDASIPGVNDSWSVYFKIPLRDDNFDLMLEHGDDPVPRVIVVDTVTRKARRISFL